jgi:Bifunctional DNA primase/polymerase, N-terminal
VTALEAARVYLAAGFAPIPVPWRAKGPVLEGWQSLRLTDSDLPGHFNGRPGNIGLLVGEASGNYVDVDLDAAEAIAAAPFFLPPTRMVHGRLGSRQSHWGYRVPMLPASEQFRDVGPRGGVLIELWTGARAGTSGKLRPSARPEEMRLVLVEALRVQALVAIRQERWTDAERDLEEGIVLAQEMPYPYAQARLLEVDGQRHAEQGEWDQAQARLEAALAIFRQLGAVADVRQVERALRELTTREHANRDPISGGQMRALS